MEKYFKVSESELRELLITAIKWQHLLRVNDAKYWGEEEPSIYDLLERACESEGLPKPRDGHYGYDDLANYYLRLR